MKNLKDAKTTIYPSTTRGGKELPSSSALDSPSVLSKLATPTPASAIHSDMSHVIDDATSAIHDTYDETTSMLDTTVPLGEFLDELREDDLLIITADHGNDPTHTGTDHTREKVPFFAYSPSMEGYGKLEDQNTFAVIGATIADNFEVKMPEGTIGSSLLDELK